MSDETRMSGRCLERCRHCGVNCRLKPADNSTHYCWHCECVWASGGQFGDDYHMHDGYPARADGG